MGSNNYLLNEDFTDLNSLKKKKDIILSLVFCYLTFKMDVLYFQVSQKNSLLSIRHLSDRYREAAAETSMTNEI